MAVPLIKPGLVSGKIITEPSSATLGTMSSDEADSFVIKATDVDYDFYSPLAETTGDSDPMPRFENNLLLYANVRIRGAARGSSAIGIANLVASNSGQATKNPIDRHLFALGVESATNDSNARELLNLILWIERIRLRWDRTGQFLGLAFSARMSDMSAANVTNIEVGGQVST